MTTTSPSYLEAIGSTLRAHWLSISFIVLTVALVGFKLYVDFVLTPKCEAIWAEPRIVVRATYGLKPQCERFTVPIRTPIPKDSEIETATLDGGPK